jgi:hypothetical protein
LGYEIYIWPKHDKQTTLVDSFVNAFSAAGIPARIEADQFGCWLLFLGHESALSLDVKDGAVTGGGMKLSVSEDWSFADKIVNVLRSLDWAAGDDEGELE